MHYYHHSKNSRHNSSNHNPNNNRYDYRKNSGNHSNFGNRDHKYRCSSNRCFQICFQQKQLPVVILVLLIIIELIILFTAVRITAPAMNKSVDATENSRQSGTDITQNAAGNSEESVSGGLASADANSSLAEQCCTIYESNTDLLVLVNKDNTIPDDYSITLQMTTGGKVQVAAILYNDLVKMLADASDAGGYSYALISGYRSSEYQQQLVDNDVHRYMSEYGMTYEEALEKTYEQVMPAGYSEHETGLALDITAAGNTALDESQANEPATQWLDENCWKYGFILRYPKDKEDVTGISYEPWHFRYVGREAAKFMHENNLTLEEFYEYLQ